MTPEQFVYWLQGYFEISESNSLDEQEIKIIREHLAKVFNRDINLNYLCVEPVDVKYQDNKWVYGTLPARSCGSPEFIVPWGCGIPFSWATNSYIDDFGCISSFTCNKCKKYFVCDSSGKAGTTEGNTVYIDGPCCCCVTGKRQICGDCWNENTLL